MKYDVTVSEDGISEQHFWVDATKCEENVSFDDDLNNEDSNKCDNDPAMVLEISRTEYEHTVKRLDRLDNKVYILLTVCAFIIVMLTAAIGNIGEARIPETCIGWIVLVMYVGVVIAAAIMTVLLLKGLIGALSSIVFNRLESPDIVDFDMALSEKNQVARYVIGIYEQSTSINNKRIDEKYKTVDCCVNLLIKTVIVLIIVTGISVIVPKAEEQEEKMSDIITVIEECVLRHMENSDDEMANEENKAEETESTDISVEVEE